MEDIDEQPSLEELVKKCKLYEGQNNHRKAIEILEFVLEVQTLDVGEDDLTVVTLLSYLGRLLMKAGRVYEALEKYKRALEIRVKKLGEEHLDLETALYYKDIGDLFLQLDKMKKAEEMYRKAIDIGLEILPENHPDQVDFYQRLTIPLIRQGKLSEAHKMQKQILATLLETHGEEHPDVVKVIPQHRRDVGRSE